MTGTITRVIAEKGFGFIVSNGQDYFFHRNDMQGQAFASLRPGVAVTFAVSTGPKGPRAEKVRVVTGV